jgi:hypothetical protein
VWILPTLLALLLVPASGTHRDPPGVRYRLRATVDDIGRTVRGEGEVVYRHAGPATLAALTFSFAPSPTSDPPRDRRFTVTGGDGLLAHDSSRARVELPHPLAVGDSVVLHLAWESALPPNRNGNARGAILADWYPRILDEVSGATEPLAAIGVVQLDLDVADDQVVAASGVPVCGDPGWAAARRTPRVPLTLQRHWYRSADTTAGCSARSGRKRVVWQAESVTELAVAMSPTFVYEEGDFLEKPVRALYEAGGERQWGTGLATQRVETALAWTTELAGRYPWPHATVVQAGDGVARALPMLLVASDPGQGALLDLLGLMITQQMLPGSNRALAVGAAAFETAWFFEVLGRRDDYARLERTILDWDLDGLGRRNEPVTASRTGSPCATTFCRRTEFTYHQLRSWAGNDAVIAALFRAHFTEYQLRPAVSGGFQRLAGEFVTPRPDTLYRQLPGGTVLYDDAVTAAHRVLGDDGRWRTTVVVERQGKGVFPRVLWVVGDADTGVARLPSLAARETVTVATATRPRFVLLDPQVRSHDWDMLDNQRVFGFRPERLLLAPHRPSDLYLDPYFTRRTSRSQLTMGIAPTAWYNDAGGWTLGLRLREDYLGRFERHEAWASIATGWAAPNGRVDANGQLRLRNPTWLRAPLWDQTAAVGYVEGRLAADVGVERRLRTSVTDSTLRAVGLSVAWMTVTAPRYLDDGFWDDASHAEVTLSGRMRGGTGGWRWRTGVTAALGLQDGDAVDAGTYGRFTAEAVGRRAFGRRLGIGGRFFGGAVAGRSVVAQRKLYLAGADPVERFASPFLRSEGSLFTSADLRYHQPGGAGVRGLDPHVAASTVLGASLEAEYAVVKSVGDALFSRIAFAAFTDAAFADGQVRSGTSGLDLVADAGLGLRIDHRIGRTSFQTRLDMPFWVSRPELGYDTDDSPVSFRWLVSLVPSF